MHNLLVYLNLIACLVSVLLILMYQRDGTFKRSVSVSAWVLAVCMFAQGVYPLLSAYQATYHGTGISILLMIATLRSRGNVACLFRLNHEHS